MKLKFHSWRCVRVCAASKHLFVQRVSVSAHTQHYTALTWYYRKRDYVPEVKALFSKFVYALTNSLII